MTEDLESKNIILIKLALRASNYTILSDYAGANQSEWVAHRAALRDLPNDPNWPDIVFPTTPDEPPLG